MLYSQVSILYLKTAFFLLLSAKSEDSAFRQTLDGDVIKKALRIQLGLVHEQKSVLSGDTRPVLTADLWRAILC